MNTCNCWKRLTSCYCEDPFLWERLHRRWGWHHPACPESWNYIFTRSLGIFCDEGAVGGITYSWSKDLTFPDVFDHIDCHPIHSLLQHASKPKTRDPWNLYVVHKEVACTSSDNVSHNMTSDTGWRLQFCTRCMKRNICFMFWWRFFFKGLLHQ